MDLTANKLTQIPKEIAGLQSLKMASFASNQLSTLPKEIGGLQKLYLLRIYKNQFPQQAVDKIRELLPNCSVENE